MQIKKQPTLHDARHLCS